MKATRGYHDLFRVVNSVRCQIRCPSSRVCPSESEHVNERRMGGGRAIEEGWRGRLSGQRWRRGPSGWRYTAIVCSVVAELHAKAYEVYFQFVIHVPDVLSGGRVDDTNHRYRTLRHTYSTARQDGLIGFSQSLHDTTHKLHNTTRYESSYIRQA